MSEPLRITNVNVFDSQEGRVGGPFDVTVSEAAIASGPRNPYPGRLGVVAEGAIADLILVDGDPVADISLISRPAEAFVAIIKDGRLVKGADLAARF